jgi:phosphoserine aminotransferase
MFEKIKTHSDKIPSDPRFGSGPSLIPVKFLERLVETGPHLLGTSHRKSPVKNIVKGIQEGLRSLLSVPKDYKVVLGNGGATFLFDMISFGMVEKKALHFTCGEFSEKWFKASSVIPWTETEKISVPYGEGVTPRSDESADLIAVTLNETSTGVMCLELPEVGEKTLLAVDATSGGGQLPCDISKTDIFFFSPQKVFGSEGGLYVAILSPKAVERAMSINETSQEEENPRFIPHIMNWKTAIDNGEKHQTYNTPAISTLFFLHEQVKEMAELGFNKVFELAKSKSDLVYNWALEKPYLGPYIKDQKFRSLAVATIDVDEKIEVDKLIKVLEKEKIVYGIDSYRKLGRNQFRIALFHNVSFSDLKKLTELISILIEESGALS